MSSKPVRVRFCPSPTGFLHIGGVRTALFNYLFAKKHNGTFILRLEDTDRERFVEAGVGQIVEVLDWLGLKPDEGYWQGEHSGDFGPYIQSERLPHYTEIAHQLVDSGLAYRSAITPEDFNQLKTVAMQSKQAFVYRRSMEAGISSTADDLPIRLDITAVGQKLGLTSITWHDEVRGDFEVDLKIIDDFVIVKADGFPTYNFANIVDDHQMEISHVMRGDEFISSTPKHALLYDALGFDRPLWVHLPVILGNDGSKLSKRHGDTDALQYREKGYLPEALLNFLAQLGWNDGTEKEVFSLDEMIEKFSLERIQKSPAKFDMERLNWFNGLYIREQLTENEYVHRAEQELTAAGIEAGANLRQIVLLERERVKSFAELPDLVGFFFKQPHAKESAVLATKKLSSETVRSYIEFAVGALSECTDEEVAIEEALRGVVEREGIKVGDFFSTIRIGVTGRTAAPGLFETIHTLTIKESLDRLRKLNAAL
ncbi:glutamate--tRNA ligase [Patescibacteria group bacterium]|nr:MAG: glutamate--tRNA ligase [Patescibacteria group bacterium]